MIHARVVCVTKVNMLEGVLENNSSKSNGNEVDNTPIDDNHEEGLNTMDENDNVIQVNGTTILKTNLFFSIMLWVNLKAFNGVSNTIFTQILSYEMLFKYLCS